MFNCTLHIKNDFTVIFCYAVCANGAKRRKISESVNLHTLCTLKGKMRHFLQETTDAC